jgi:hypothetical protein
MSNPARRAVAELRIATRPAVDHRLAGGHVAEPGIARPWPERRA